MKAIYTKQEFLEFLRGEGACDEGIAYVESHPSEYAWEIWETCPTDEWLIWAGAKRNPEAALTFAEWCAARAPASHAPVYASAARKAVAESYFWVDVYHAHTSAILEKPNGAERDAERQAHLDKLHSMWGRPRQLTKQELFDKVVRHIVAQGKPSIDARVAGNGVCKYASADGCQCAAGALVPPALRGCLIEGQGWDAQPSLLHEVIGHSDFVRELQSAHDQPTLLPHSYGPFRHAWRNLMRKVARLYALSTETLDTLATEEWQKAG